MSTNQRQLIDLSQAIREQPGCSFSVLDTVPRVTFQEGDAHGMYFITTRIDNLLTNISTHADLPGHIHMPSRDKALKSSVGEYPLERFVGKAMVVDVSEKLQAIERFFTEGKLNINPTDGERCLEFLRALDNLEVTEEEVSALLAHLNIDLAEVQGVFFYTGLSRWWVYDRFESWEYAYFFSPFLASQLCQNLKEKGIFFVGIDAFQLEHPIINFRGDELPLVLNSRCRAYVKDKLSTLEGTFNHQLLLGNDIIIYENLNLPVALTKQVFDFSGVPLKFQLDGMNDNALVRAYAIVNH